MYKRFKSRNSTNYISQYLRALSCAALLLCAAQLSATSIHRPILRIPALRDSANFFANMVTPPFSQTKETAPPYLRIPTLRGSAIFVANMFTPPFSSNKRDSSTIFVHTSSERQPLPSFIERDFSTIISNAL